MRFSPVLCFASSSLHFVPHKSQQTRSEQTLIQMEPGSQCGVWLSAPSVRPLSFVLEISSHRTLTLSARTALTRLVAVVIDLTPSFAILIRAGRNAMRNAGHIQHEGQEVQLTTIGGSGGSGNRHKKIPTGTWVTINDSQEALAIKQDAVSITTSARHDEESLGLAL